MNIWLGKKKFSYNQTLLVQIVAQSSESIKRSEKVLSMDILLIKINDVKAI